MKHQWWIGAVEKRRRITRVPQGDNVMTMIIRQPLARPLGCVGAGSNRVEQASQRLTAQCGLHRGPSRLENLKRAAEMLQQATRTQPRRGRSSSQGQPRMQFILDLDHRAVERSGTIMGLRHFEQRLTQSQSHHPSVGTGLLPKGGLRSRP